jgi:hydroxymethylbilane synthase
VPLSIGLSPRRGSLPAAWRELLPEVKEEEGPSEEALLERLADGAVDAALVASRPGSPATRAAEVPGLAVGAVPLRPEPRDVLVATEAATLATLPDGARVALAGQRRRALLAAHRPELEAVDLPARGAEAVEAFLRGGGADAAVLAAHVAREAGLSHAATEVLQPKAWLPGAGQGASVLLVRAGDHGTREALAPLHHAPTGAALEAEAAVGRALGLGADAPLGALALPYGRWLRLWTLLLSRDGRRVVRADRSGSDLRPAELGREVAAVLLDRGAGLLPESAAAGGGGETRSGG